MLRNYLKIAGRHLWKHQRYVLINLLGLGVALAMCILAYLSWKFDRDFDQFHVHKEHIFRVETSKESTKQMFGVSPVPLAELAEEEIAGVQAGITVDSRSMIVTNGKDTYREQITFSGPGLLKWFSFPVVAGQGDLSDPNNLLITEKMAVKYFGIDDPVGKTLTLNPGEPSSRNLKIAGVLKDPPLNSSLQFDLLANFHNQTDGEGMPIKTDDWTYFADATFLVLSDPSKRQDISEYLQAYIPVQNAAREDWQAGKFRLEPLSEMAHHAWDLRGNSMINSLPASMIWGTIVMALLLLLTGCLNFTNTTISLAGKRLKEIGLRKVLGSNRGQLIGQLLAEGFLLSLAGLAFGLFLVDQLLPHYNRMWRFLDLRLTFADNLPLVGFLLAGVLGTTILAAAYPAFYVSGFSPNKIFRGTLKLAGNNLLSRILLGTQVAISALAIVAGISFAKNASFQQNTDLGFQREGIQAVFTPDEQEFSVLKQVVQQWPEVESVAGVHSHIGDSAPRVEFSLRQELGETEWMMVGADYLETMDIRLQHGRFFNYDLASEFDRSLLVNEQFAKAYFPGEDPVGQEIIVFDSIRYAIIGVVRNFMQDSFFDPLRPLAITLAQPDRFRYLVVRSRMEDLAGLRTRLEQAWKSNFPDRPFEHYFQNDFLAGSLEITNNIKQMFTVFSLITLFLTIAGLASLLSLNVMKRLKEITIRRILGAGSAQIVYLLSSRYLLIIGISLFIGGLAGLWLTQTLLDNIFQTHAGVSMYSVFVAAVLVLFVVMLTITSRLLGVITGNPVQHLNSEG